MNLVVWKLFEETGWSAFPSQFIVSLWKFWGDVFVDFRPVFGRKFGHLFAVCSDWRCRLLQCWCSHRNAEYGTTDEFEEARVAPTSAIIHPIRKRTSQAIIAYHLFERWEFVVAEKIESSSSASASNPPQDGDEGSDDNDDDDDDVVMTVAMTATTAMTLSYFQILMRGTFGTLSRSSMRTTRPSTFWWTSPTTFWWWRPVSHRSWDFLFVINDWFMLRMFWKITWFWVPYLRLAMTTSNFSSNEVVEWRNNTWRKTKHSINWKSSRRRRRVQM